MRIAVDVANEVAVAIQLSQCRERRQNKGRFLYQQSVCVCESPVCSKVQFGINLCEFAYAAKDRKAA